MLRTTSSVSISPRAARRRSATVAAVTFNHGRYLEYYRQLIEQAAPLPDPFTGDLPSQPEPARFPHPAAPAYPYHGPTVIVTGHSPVEMDAVRVTGT